MYEFRPFSNRDVPHLARIWTNQPPQRALVQPMTPCVLEQYLFSKLHFDPHGFIVATRNRVPVGFAHAGFGPSDTPHELDTTLGVTHRVMVDPSVENVNLSADLLGRSEEYLASRGTKVFYGGGIRPLNAFYLGLYGGSESPGVLDSDPSMQKLFAGAGYRIIDRVVVLQCNLNLIRASVTWASRQWNRCTHMELMSGCHDTSWWRKRTNGCIESQRFELHHSDESLLAFITLWDLEPLATSWGTRAVGVLEFQVAESMRRRGIATHFLSELMRQLRLQGVAVIEAQTMIHNEPALAMYRKLGFVEVDRGAVFRKDASGA